MTDNPDEGSTSDGDELLLHLGKLIVTWNDLETLIRQVLYTLSDRDILTAAILMADMSITGLMNVLRPLAFKYDEWQRAMFVDLQSERRLRDYLGPRQIEPVAPHVNHLIEFTDRLREYRNFYIHGINRPRPGKGFRARTQTARTKFVIFEQPITLADLQILTSEIERCIGYGFKVIDAVVMAREHMSSRDVGPPTWPEKPLLPDRLKKLPRSQQDA